MTLRHGVIVLAAGASRRLGRPKQLVAIDGETLLHRTARHALATHPADVVVVVGPAANGSATAVTDLPVRCIEATAPQAGMGASLRRGVAALSTACDGVLVLVCDQPALDAAHLIAMVARWHERPHHAVASGYAGTCGVPALLPRDWLAAAAIDGDRGARDLLRARGADVDVVRNEALASDIDHPSDLPTLPVEPSR